MPANTGRCRASVSCLPIKINLNQSNHPFGGLTPYWGGGRLAPERMSLSAMEPAPIAHRGELMAPTGSVGAVLFSCQISAQGER